MATRYRFRCDECGDFDHEQPMAHTTRHHWCPTCGAYCPKVLNGNLQFTYTRDVFHGGVDGQGLTSRETQRKWVADAKRAGLEIESAYRHV